MPVSKEHYVLIPDGKGDVKAVVNDGKQNGAILVAQGGTVTAELAKKYKLSTDADAPTPEPGDAGLITAPAPSRPVGVADAQGAIRPAGAETSLADQKP